MAGLFYDAESQKIGGKYFVKFRRAATNVRVGNHPQASVMVANHFLTSTLVDPQLIVVNECLVAIPDKPINSFRSPFCTGDRSALQVH